MQNFLFELETLPVYPVEYNTKDVWLLHAEASAEMIKESLVRQYVHDETVVNYMRMSSVGKTPALDLAARKFGLIPPGNTSTVNAQQRLLFWTGDAFECWVYFQLKRLGYNVQTQLEVDYRGVSGHIDFLCERDGETFVLETKTANDFYFQQVSKFGVGDERGYLTQLAGYAEALEVPAYWLFVNKNTSELLVIPCERELYLPRIKRLDNIIDCLNKITTFNEAYEYFRPVPPSVECSKGKPVLDDTGKPLLFVPSNVSHPDLHYRYEVRKTKYSKLRKYVTDYNQLYTRTNVHEDALQYAGL